MSRKLMLFCLLFPIFCLAQPVKELAGYDWRVDNIAEGIEAGAWLVYDCEKKHWACLLEEYYVACEEKRAEDILNRKKELRCAPIGSFATKKSCFQRQLYMVGQNWGARFCIPDSEKELRIRF